MATYSHIKNAMGLKGHRASIFFEMNNFGNGTQTYIQRLTILDKWYSHLRAYLPLVFEKHIDEYNDKFVNALIKVDGDLTRAWELYKPTFESIESFDPDEKEFSLFMRLVYIELDEITAESKVVNSEQLDDSFEAG